jgi:hypothetical protein
MRKVHGLVAEVWSYRRLLFDDFLGMLEIPRLEMNGTIQQLRLLNRKLKMPSPSQRISGFLLLQIRAS